MNPLLMGNYGGFGGGGFGGMGGMGGGGNVPNIQVDSRPPKEKYAAQLAQVKEMGFLDEETVL